MCNYHELVPLHSRIFPPINKFYTALICIYYFLISTGVSYIFFTTKSVTMTRHPLPDLGWNQPVVLPAILSAAKELDSLLSFDLQCDRRLWWQLVWFFPQIIFLVSTLCQQTKYCEVVRP